MTVPASFAESNDEQSLREAISAFGTTKGISGTDLLTSLGSIERWYQQFPGEFCVEHRGAKIFWRGYESLIWALGESFRHVMVRNRRLRRDARIFGAVQSVCLDRRFGKGRESFVLLLGQYGGPEQIPILIELLQDQEVCGHAVCALRVLGAPEAAGEVKPFLDSPKTWIRQEARKFFKKIGSANK